MIFKQSPETQKLKHAEARLLCSTPYDPTIPFLGIDPEKTIKSQHYYNIWDKEATSVSINRGMDKQDVGQIYSGILLCGEKEWIRVICRDMHGPKEYHAEWSKSEKQRSQINSYVWNPEKQYRWAYLQSRMGDTDVEDRRMDTKEGDGVPEAGPTHTHYRPYA